MAQTRLSIGLNGDPMWIEFRSWITIQRNCSRFKQKETLAQIIILYIIFVQFFILFFFSAVILGWGHQVCFACSARLKLLLDMTNKKQKEKSCSAISLL